MPGAEVSLPHVGPRRRRRRDVHGDYTRRLAPPLSSLIASTTLMGSIDHRAEALWRSECFSRCSALPPPLRPSSANTRARGCEDHHFLLAAVQPLTKKIKALFGFLCFTPEGCMCAASALCAVRGPNGSVRKCFGDERSRRRALKSADAKSVWTQRQTD